MSEEEINDSVSTELDVSKTLKAKELIEYPARLGHIDAKMMKTVYKIFLKMPLDVLRNILRVYMCSLRGKFCEDHIHTTKNTNFIGFNEPLGIIYIN